MEGFDDDWSPPGTDHSATYTNLDPGDYVFRVRGSNSDGVWNEEGTSLRITISPPWWETTRFRVLALALMVGLLIGAYRWRVRSVEAHSRELEEEVASKTRDLQQEISEHEETVERLRKTGDELATLMTVSRDIVSTLELDPLLELILDQLRQVVDYDGAGILTLETESLQFRIYRGLPVTAELMSIEIPVEAVSPIRRLIVDQQSFIINDVHQEPGLSVEMKTAIGFGIEALFGNGHAWMGIPMIVSDKVIGLMGLIHQEPGFFQTDNLSLTQTFANQAAIALENARLYDQGQAAAVAEERNRLARDLHDSVTQSLYSASLLAEVLPEIRQRDPDEAERGLEELRHLTRGALAEMRTMLLELRPETLVKTPLGDLLEQLVEALTSRMEIDTRVDIQPVLILPPDAHINIYRVAQEALNNVVKHSEASQLLVTLLPTPPFSGQSGDGWRGQIELRVEDDGKGFDAKEIPLNSLGLGIMRERAAEIGATLTIEGRLNQGTTILMVWRGNDDQTEKRSRP